MSSQCKYTIKHTVYRVYRILDSMILVFPPQRKLTAHIHIVFNPWQPMFKFWTCCMVFAKLLRSYNHLHSPPEVASTSMFSSATCSLGMWCSRTLRYTYTQTNNLSLFRHNFHISFLKNQKYSLLLLCVMFLQFNSFLYHNDMQYCIRVKCEWVLQSCWLVAGFGNTSWCHGRCESLWLSARNENTFSITSMRKRQLNVYF